jgi:hypothetical protein
VPATRGVAWPREIACKRFDDPHATRYAPAMLKLWQKTTKAIRRVAGEGRFG